MKIFHYLKILWDLILHAPLLPVYYLSGFYPRKPNVWIFSCWEGKKFRGNSKYLFLHAQKKCSEIDSIWITKDKNILIKLQNEGLKALYAFSIQGILANLRAKCFIVSHGIADINEYVSRNGIIINLSHSTYPIKNMNSKINKNAGFFLRSYLYLRYPYGLLIKPDYAITSSKFTSKATQHHYSISLKKIIPCGIPKTDYLLNPEDDRFALKSEMNMPGRKDLVAEKGGKKLILYLPTWRENMDFTPFAFGFDPGALQKALEKLDAVMAFNFHPFAKNKKIPELNKYPNIHIMDYQADQTNSLLINVDLLITDYSAVFADFLLYNRPIIFANFDHDNYLTGRDLFINYSEDLPGPKVESWPKLLGELERIFILQDDPYATMRATMREKIYNHADGKVCQRIVEVIKKLLYQS